MGSNFKQLVANSTAHRPVRDMLSGMVINNKDLLHELMAMALDTTNKNHHKACWSLELVMETHIVWLSDYLDVFCKRLSTLKHEGALRSVSKICLFAVQYDKKSKGFLSPKNLELIIESCFDWLIDPKGKVATKAYTMRALYICGENNDWIYPELQRILQEDAAKHTAAYKAAAKEVLHRISKI
ncbi:hypothetical protein GR160_11165 [Flavobacterium sp. Sd200]|uniref:hypothetical protein n=1 Tax=Flavobacterium sp. Sd200 TaxID=2692211 RepID=UPI0013697545|nr:hypothetical protein [Flavobacterium sp. Sd200]MXN91785.1 hypothetical protein [Flavobacterium sp. Sd200]